MLNRLLRLAVATLSLVEPAIAAAQTFPPDSEIESLIQARIEEDRAVGLVVGLLEADGSRRIVVAGEAGQGARPLDEETIFEIGSITKVFTGSLLADMVRRGEVQLSDPISEYLPDHVGVPSRGRRQITLLDLATHRSGLPRLPINMSPADVQNPYADYTVEQMYEFLSGYDLPRDIGAAFEYSNLGVGLLGHVLSLAAGTPYEDLLTERILGPLGMESTFVTPAPGTRDRIAHGHDASGGAVPLWDLPTLAGAGALRSDVGDMLTFLEANAGRPANGLEEALRFAQLPRAPLTDEAEPRDSIGLGWLIVSPQSRRIVWHNGGTGGFRSFAGFDRDRGVGVVVLSNMVHSVDDIGLHLLDSDIPLSAPARQPDVVTVSPEVLEQYVGEYQLAPTFAIEVTLEDGNLYGQATNQPRFQMYAESETEFFLRVVDARITFERDSDGSVTGLVLHQGGQSMPGQKVR